MHRICKLLLCLHVAASACGEGLFEAGASRVAWFAWQLLKFQIKARTVPWFLMLELFLFPKKPALFWTAWLFLHTAHTCFIACVEGPAVGEQSCV